MTKRSRTVAFRCSTLALTVWALACTEFHPATADFALPAGRFVQVRSDRPFALAEPGLERESPSACHATELRGRVLRMAGDTLVIQRGFDVEAVPRPDGSRGTCARSGAISVVLAPGIALTEERFNRVRTTVLVLAIAAGLVGVVAWAASQLEFEGLPGGVMLTRAPAR